MAAGARNREYVGTVDWLNDAGIINVSYCLESPELPLKENYKPNDYKIYYRDTGLLIASLDEEAQIDLRQNKNFNTYKGSIYENIIADIFAKQGYGLFYYKNEKYSDIKYGIKFCNKNIGFNEKFYTFPYFCAFMLKRCLNEES